MRATIRVVASPLIALAALAALAGCATTPAADAGMRVSSATDAHDRSAADPVDSAPSPAAAAHPSVGPPDFSAAVARLGPAVVGILAVKLVAVEGDDADADQDPESLAELLRRHGLPLAQSKPARVALRDQGCGVVVTRDGYILTAAHVIADAAVVMVQLRDGRELPGRPVGVDLPSDVAVLKIEASDLQPATLGRSARLQPGSWIAAIGSPFGLKGSVAVGVVSALDRTLPGDDTYQPFIQTDLALNPGNSGGPLLDAQGEVVGINSQIVFTGGGEAGVSFAIPIETAQSVEAQLIRRGRVERGDLGMAFQDVDVGLARALGRGTPAGALVNAIRPDGPAARASLRAGDIVVGLDDRAVNRASELASAVAARRPGSTAMLAVWRAHALVRIPVGIGATESFAAEGRASGSAEEPAAPALSVRELSPKESRALSTSGRLLVTGVSAQAAAAGVGMGDVILGTADTSLRSAHELARAFTASSGVIALLIEHDGSRTFVAVPLGSAGDSRRADAATAHHR